MPALSQSTFKQLVREALLADSGVTSLVGDDGVYSAHLSDADASTVLDATPIVVFEPLSGFVMYNRQVGSITIEVYGWSKISADHASRVYDAAFSVLQAGKLSVAGLTMCGLAREVQRPVEGYADTIMAWFARGRWTVNVTEEA